jgi:hypothetical protein
MKETERATPDAPHARARFERDERAIVVVRPESCRRSRGDDPEADHFFVVADRSHDVTDLQPHATHVRGIGQRIAGRRNAIRTLGSRHLRKYARTGSQ